MRFRFVNTAVPPMSAFNFLCAFRTEGGCARHKFSFRCSFRCFAVQTIQPIGTMDLTLTRKPKCQTDMAFFTLQTNSLLGEIGFTPTTEPKCQIAMVFPICTPSVHSVQLVSHLHETRAFSLLFFC